MKTRLSCVVCGMLGYWGYEREIKDLELMKKAHMERQGENHEVTWEIEQ